jgi:hypothetical protein
MTKISCTFVKCKHNNYGKSGYCLRDEIQIGGQVDPKDDQRKVKPVCVYFERKKEVE